MSSSIGSSSASVTSDNDELKYPLWKYVTKLEASKIGGGNSKFECHYCNHVFNGSYSRVKAHLLRISGHGIATCKSVNNEQIAKMNRAIEEANLMLTRKLPKEVPLPTTQTMGGSGHGTQGIRVGGVDTYHTTQKKRKGNSIEEAFKKNARDEVHAEIARMFYSAGLPFHLAKNPHYIRAFTMLSEKKIDGYIPPGYNALRTKLLHQERNHINQLLALIKYSWKEKGVTIATDGWTDAQRRPIINFMAICGSGSVFLKAVNCQGEYKDKHFIVGLIREVILEVGSENVVQVITDNALVCKSAGLLIEGQFPRIFWTPCVVHTLNLALKNICAAKDTSANEVVYDACNWITVVGDDCFFIKNFISNHSMRLAMFLEHNDLKMLSIAETRFASTIVMMKRFRQIKVGLKKMVICEKWDAYREDDVHKAAKVSELILNDLWWDQVDYILAFTEPIYDMLRKTDTDIPCLHLVYDMWDTMIEKVKKVIFQHDKEDLNSGYSSFFNVVYNILVDRWTKSNTPLHCLAHSLNPRYYSEEWLEADSNRRPPHKDNEVVEERDICFGRYFANPDERRQVKEEYAKFSGSFGGFANIDAARDRGKIEPVYWWVLYGASTPLLQSLALRLLGHPSSSSCCERNWSTYSFIHSVIRNKITPERAEDLVFVHSNLRVLSRAHIEYKNGESKMWDIAGNTFDPMEGSGLLAIANLTLDEPELEGVLFLDDDNANDYRMD